VAPGVSEEVAHPSTVTDGDFTLEWSADGQQIITPHPSRGLLLWEVRDLLRQRRYMRLFYGMDEEVEG